jgi:hypothetical protein
MEKFTLIPHMKPSKMRKLANDPAGALKAQRKIRKTRAESAPRPSDYKRRVRRTSTNIIRG